MRIAITGGTGFVGQHFISQADVTVAHILSRDAVRAGKLFPSDEDRTKTIRAFAWDSSHEPAPADAFEDVDAVVHLLGETVQGRWNKDKKRRIRDSRVLGTKNLVKALTVLPNKPRVLIAGSAVGFYGDCGDEELNEQHVAGSGFLADVCQQWEAVANEAAKSGIRVVNLRTGLVLGEDGGPLQKMLMPFRLCLGATIGDGRQYMPWIHVEDLCRMIMFAIEHEQITGPLNGTAPKPVTNTEFTRALAKQLSRPALMPAPAWLLRTMLGEFADVLLYSQRAIPAKAQQAGFEFKYAELSAALADLFCES